MFFLDCSRTARGNSNQSTQSLWEGNAFPVCWRSWMKKRSGKKARRQRSLGKLSLSLAQTFPGCVCQETSGFQSALNNIPIMKGSNISLPKSCKVQVCFEVRVLVFSCLTGGWGNWIRRIAICPFRQWVGKTLTEQQLFYARVCIEDDRKPPFAPS